MDTLRKVHSQTNIDHKQHKHQHFVEFFADRYDKAFFNVSSDLIYLQVTLLKIDATLKNILLYLSAKNSTK